jgi:hypothetical protein
MPITLSCQKCLRKLNVPDNAAGKKVKCPKCLTVMTVPDSEGPEVVAEDEDLAAVEADDVPKAIPRHAVAVASTGQERPTRGDRPLAVTAADSNADMEEDAARDRARNSANQGIGVGAIIVGVLSACFTLLAFAALGTGAWLGMDGSKTVTYVCVYGAIGLSLIGLISSLYSRGVLRLLDFLFALCAMGASVPAILIFIGTIQHNPFSTFGLAVTEREGKKPAYFDPGEITYVDSDKGNGNGWGFVTFEDMMNVMVAPPDQPASSKSSKGSGSASAPLPPRTSPRDLRFNQAKAEGKAFVVPGGTKVEVLEFDKNIKVKVLEGDLKDKELWIYEQTSLHHEKKKNK